MIDLLMIVAAALLLWKGSDWFVGGAAHIAQGFGVPELIVGLTIVAMGTSGPELAVSVTAALQGDSAIALGNVVGSNVFNLGIVLGICALIQTLHPVPEVWRRDGPVLILGVAMTWWFLADGRLGRYESIGLLALMFAYLLLLFFTGKAPPGDELDGEDDEFAGAPPVKTWVLMVIGLAMILLGGRLLVDGATAIATAFGMSSWLISVTIVAAGTSAPELVTSVTAARKGMASMALGGLIGSDIFNALLVLGVAGFVAPIEGVGDFRPSVALLGLTVVGTILMAYWRKKLGRPEGIFLLVVAISRWVGDAL